MKKSFWSVLAIVLAVSMLLGLVPAMASDINDGAFAEEALIEEYTESSYEEEFPEIPEEEVSEAVIDQEIESVPDVVKEEYIPQPETDQPETAEPEVPVIDDETADELPADENVYNTEDLSASDEAEITDEQVISDEDAEITSEEETEDSALLEIQDYSEPEIVFEEIILDFEEEYFDTSSKLPSSDELVMGYIEKVFDVDDATVFDVASAQAANQLSGYNLLIYKAIKTQIANVAAGKQTSTEFEVTVDELGLNGKTWTAADLGVDSIIKNGAINEAAVDALYYVLDINTRSIIDSLLADCPYELYWYDKTLGVSFAGISANTNEIFFPSGMTFSFVVAEEYQGSSMFEVDPGTGQTITTARNNAAAVVSQYASSSDKEKLVGYKNAICSYVSYNDAAAQGGMAYGNPWQLIYVFDGNPNTNVVCEGYSKAFKYLCDLTSFKSSMVSCITVAGYMSGGTGAGAHMWNVVKMDDGKNYIADVTNCDADTIGAGNLLFLVGMTKGSTNADYYINVNNTRVSYSYDSYFFSIYNEQQLELSSSDYVEGNHIHTAVTDPAIEATCTTAGKTEGSHCSICGIVMVEQKTVPAKGHTVKTDEARAATCTETGLTKGSHCSVCGETIEAQTIIPALGHNWSSWTVTKAATETEKGVETRTCSNDTSHKETREIPVLAHTHKLVKTAAKAATCTADGNTEYWTCSGCNRIFSDASGNNEINKEDTIIKAKGHTPVTDKAKAATCTATGLTEGSHCSVCGYVIKEQSVIPALGHNWSDWTVTKAATETETGVETRKCSNDPSHVETRTIPVLAHTHNLVKTDSKAATCTAAGNTDYWTCSGCGRIFSDASGNNEINIEDTVIPAKGHTSVTDAAVAATCTTDGKTEGRHCSVCNAVIKAQEVIPALGHHLAYVPAKEATTSAAGNKEHYKCDRCNKLFSDANGKTEITAASVVIPKLAATIGITSSVTTNNVAGGIQIDWEPVNGASGYLIYRRIGSGSYTHIKTVSGSSNTSFTDTAATSNGKVYIYLIYTYAKADGKTIYSSDCNYSFTYRLTKPTISRVTNSASKKMTVKWNKNAKAAGYVIQYSQKSSFASGKYAVVYSAATVSKVISGLTKGKTYYVRMCSYRRYGGITHYSDWSNTMTVKISK